MKGFEIQKSNYFFDIKRIFFSRAMMALISISALLALIPLLSIFYYVIKNGWLMLNTNFFLNKALPLNESGILSYSGGMGPSVFGSLLLVLLASFMGVLWGIASGIYIAEYGEGKTAWLLKFTNDLLAGVPSIVIGIFIYTLVVVPMGGFSLLAGSIALAILMVPTISRSTEEILKTIPRHLREAGLALGLNRTKVLLFIILRGSAGVILTGVILSVARVSGETAPLLFTAFNNQYWSGSILEPISSLPVQLYNYAISPFKEWQAQAWTAALVLILFVVMINFMTRFLFIKDKHSR